MGLNMREKQAVTGEYKPRYQKASKKDKKSILDEFTRLTGYHRKSAVRVLGAKPINPLTIRDEFSKFILAIEAAEKGDITSVKAVFIRLFKQFGMPRIIRSDNGPPFANMLNYWGLTRLSVWWLSLGIQLDRITPGHPEENGGHERMHRDMKKELQGKTDGTLGEHQNVFNEWRHVFNTLYRVYPMHPASYPT